MSVPHSVGYNDITGDGAEQLAKVVLEHTSLTDFCSIPLVSLRENSLTDLDLNCKGVGVPGAIVLSSLMPTATALKSLEYAPSLEPIMRKCQQPLTVLAFCDLPCSQPGWQQPHQRRQGHVGHRPARGRAQAEQLVAEPVVRCL